MNVDVNRQAALLIRNTLMKDTLGAANATPEDRLSSARKISDFLPDVLKQPVPPKTDANN